MLNISINGESLDLFPDTRLELERNNPFLQLAEAIIGTYSFPFSVKNTAKNNRLLGYSGTWQKVISSTGIDAVLLDGGIPMFRGKIKVEETEPNLNDADKTSISCYFLTEVSGFFQEVKNKKLTEVDYEGDRVFNGVATDVDKIFINTHVLNIMNGVSGPYDYAFFPVKNTQWTAGPRTDIDIINYVWWAPTNNIATEYDRAYVPYPKLKYVLQRIFIDAGWSLEGDHLTEATFEKIHLLGNKALKWGYYTITSGPVWTFYDYVTINLQQHVPEVDVSAFLIAIMNRLGIWFDFDNHGRKATMYLLNTLSDMQAQDISSIASPLARKTPYQESKIYSLKCTDGIGGGKFSETDVDYQGRVNTRASLPTATSDKIGQVYFVTGENNYYQCVDTGSYTYVWEVFSANMYDYIPDGATDEINTMAGIVPMVEGNSYMTLIPQLDNPGEYYEDAGGVNTGIHLCFWHGAVAKATASSELYPYGSPHPYDPSMNQLTDWGLPYVCYLTDGTDVGLYNTFWKAFLDLLNSTEEARFTIYPAMHTYMNLNFRTTLILNGVKFFIKTMKPTIPYDGKLAVVGLRV